MWIGGLELDRVACVTLCCERMLIRSLAYFVSGCHCVDRAIDDYVYRRLSIID